MYGETQKEVSMIRYARDGAIYSSAAEILLNANELFRAERSEDLSGVIAEKIADLRHYDVEAMDRVVAITYWGRSGSILLASYLDGHDDILMLPGVRSDSIDRFFEIYPSLPLQQKLIAYPAFTQLYDATSEGAGVGASFFDGPFAISRAGYYGSVQAICQVYDKWPKEFLASRRTFFLFTHIAYNLALGRRPASSHPLIVCALHKWDDERARQLVEDFPQTKFIHTIRDPITSFDRFFDWLFDAGRLQPIAPSAGSAAAALERPPVTPVSDVAAWSVVRIHLGADRPYSGMESRTRAVRFEDLHSDIAQTMRDLSDWIALPYQAALLDSTFNGIPYVVTRGGKTWSGPRAEQGQRHFRNMSLKDRTLVFAVFYENFLAWHYPCPKILGQPVVRFLVLFLFPLVPMRMEIIVARAVFRRRMLHALRHANISILVISLIRMLLSRLAITWVLMREATRRIAHRKTSLQIKLLQINHR
jgi:hypothetical protein